MYTPHNNDHRDLASARKGHSTQTVIQHIFIWCLNFNKR